MNLHFVTNKLLNKQNALFKCDEICCKLATMKSFLSIFLLLFSCTTIAQLPNLSVNKQDSLAVNADVYVGFDAYDFHYFIKDNELFKKNALQTWQYKNLSLGKLTRVDICNPLKIILFYENFNTVVALDNQLNEVEKINFSVISQDLVVSAIGISSNNNFWLFNDLNQQLGLYSILKNTYIKRGLPFTKTIKNYRSDFNYFFWIESDNRLYVCDVFGKTAFLATIPDYDSVFIENQERIVYSKNKQLFYLDIVQNKVSLLKDVDKTTTSYFLKDQKLVIFTSDKIIQYKINLP